MYLDRAQWATFFPALLLIDVDLAEQCRQNRCPHCGGPLHRSDYPRKPRGGPDGLGDEVCLRLSLCCGREGCRHRKMPPSCRFLGRKVYFAAIVLVVVTMRQRRLGSASAAKLKATFGVSWETDKRWMTYFAEVFSTTSTWKRIRGLVTSTVRDDDLPAGLLEVLDGAGEDKVGGLTRCLELLATGGEEAWEHSK